MIEAKTYEISFLTDDPAMVEDLLDEIPPGGEGTEIAPGIFAEQKNLETRPGMIGSEILLTIGYKVVEGVAVKVLSDILVPLIKKYGAKLFVNGRPVEANEQAVTASLAANDLQ